MPPLTRDPTDASSWHEPLDRISDARSLARRGPRLPDGWVPNEISIARLAPARARAGVRPSARRRTPSAGTQVSLQVRRYAPAYYTQYTQARYGTSAATPASAYLRAVIVPTPAGSHYTATLPYYHNYAEVCADAGWAESRICRPGVDWPNIRRQRPAAASITDHRTGPQSAAPWCMATPTQVRLPAQRLFAHDQRIFERLDSGDAVMADMMATSTVYVLPRISADGAEYITTTPYSCRSSQCCSTHLPSTRFRCG